MDIIKHNGSSLLKNSPQRLSQKYLHNRYRGEDCNIKKLKIKISLAEQEKSMAYVEIRKNEITEIDSRIRKTDAEIDEMVFDLYGLTEEERGGLF